MTRQAIAVRQHLEEHGISLTDAQAIVGEHSSNLMSFLLGLTDDIDIEPLEILAYTLGITLNQLIGG